MKNLGKKGLLLGLLGLLAFSPLAPVEKAKADCGLTLAILGVALGGTALYKQFSDRNRDPVMIHHPVATRGHHMGYNMGYNTPAYAPPAPMMPVANTTVYGMAPPPINYNMAAYPAPFVQPSYMPVQAAYTQPQMIIQPSYMPVQATYTQPQIQTTTTTQEKVQPLGRVESQDVSVEVR